MTQVATISDNGWTQIGTALATCVLQFSGDGEVYIAAIAPTGTSVGFTVPSGEVVELPQLPALGGGVWVRSDVDVGSVRYASAAQ